MKIIVLGAAYPFRGGIAASNERLAQELLSMGHEVILVTFTVQYPSFLFPGKSQFSEDPPPKLAVKRWIHSYNPVNWLLAGRKIKKLHADIIVCRYWLPMLGPCFGSILRIAKTSQTQIVSIIDNILPHEKRPGDRAFTQYFVQAVDRFIFMSQQVGKELSLFSSSKPSVFIPHPIYDTYGEAVDRKIALEKLSLDPAIRYVLFFGFIRDYKGLDILYEAIGIINDQLPGVKFIIAGEYYTDSSRYEKLIQQLGIASNLVLHTHFISNEDVKYYFSACDLVVQPYKSATQSGIAQIAIQFKKPTLVTRVGGLQEIIEDGKTGYVVHPDKNEIAKSIITFFQSSDHHVFEEEISKIRHKYSWSNMANAVLNHPDKPI